MTACSLSTVAAYPSVATGHFAPGVLLVFGLMVLFRWALGDGQFDDLEREGERILGEGPAKLDADQAAR